MALQEYIPIEWVNGTAPAINATNLNHSEQGIKRVTDRVKEIENGELVPLGSWEWDGTTLRITVAEPAP